MKLWVASFSALLAIAVGACSNGRESGAEAASGSAASGSGGVGGTGKTGSSGTGGDGGVAGSAQAGGATAGDGSVAGSSAGGGSAGTGSDDCATLAEDVCASFESCAGYPFRSGYGDLATCVARYAAGCGAALELGALDMAACRRAISASGCQGFRGGEIPAVCIRPAGTGSTNTPCGRSSDCSSGHCSRKGECGTCVEPAGPAEPCAAAEDCEIGLVCVQGECQPALPSGAPCDGQVCGLHGWCVEGMCIELGDDGDPCSAERPCDSAAGYVCSAGTCAPVAFVDEGEVCGVTGSQPRCANGTACVAEVPLGERRCVKQPDLGEACPDGRCKPPFVCTDGVCSVVEPTFCGGE